MEREGHPRSEAVEAGAFSAAEQFVDISANIDIAEKTLACDK
jgi:hypothetical protein